MLGQGRLSVLMVAFVEHDSDMDGFPQTRHDDSKKYSGVC
jgi:hypothetical protein